MGDEWQSTHLGDQIEIMTGFPFSSEKYTDDENDIRLLRGDNVIQGRFRWENVKRWDKADAIKFEKYTLEPGDVILAMDRPWVEAGLKYAVVSKDDLPCLLVQRVARMRGKGNLDNTFLSQLIGSESFSTHLLSLQIGTAVPHISADQIRSYVIPLPPLAEQRKIAAILSTWDEAITLTRQLIAALQRRKQALMQLLLTGAVRFPEFEGDAAIQNTEFGTIPADWDYVEIRQIAEQVSKRNKADDAFPVLSCTKYDGLVDSLEYFGRQIFSEDLSTYKLVQRGQFAYATNHIEEGSIGYQNLYDNALISPMYTVFEADDRIDDTFLYRVLKTELYRHIFEVNTSASVDRRGSLRWDAFSKIRVPLPSLAEQNAIVEIIVEAEKIIHLYTALNIRLQAQKRGLMQQLLTGAVRVQV